MDPAPAGPAAPAAAPSRRQFGWSLAIALAFVPLGSCVMCVGLAGVSGAGRAMSFECNRATGACVVHDRTDRTIPLASLREVIIDCGRVHIGTNANERQCNLKANLATGEPAWLAESSGDPTTEAEYGAAAGQINAFLKGTTPSLQVAYTVRSGAGSNFTNVLTGGCSLLIGLFAAAIAWDSRRSKKAASSAPSSHAS